MSESKHEPAFGSPATLVAIAIAARRSRDRDLEIGARRELEHRFGVRLSFARNYWPAARGTP